MQRLLSSFSQARTVALGISAAIDQASTTRPNGGDSSTYLRRDGQHDEWRHRVVRRWVDRCMLAGMPVDAVPESWLAS